MHYGKEIRNLIEFDYAKQDEQGFDAERLAHVVGRMLQPFDREGAYLYYVKYGQIPNYSALPFSDCNFAIGGFVKEFKNEIMNIMHGATRYSISETEGGLIYDFIHVFLKQNVLVTFSNQENLITLFYQNSETETISQLITFLSKYRKGC